MKRFDPLMKQHFNKLYLLLLLAATAIYTLFCVDNRIGVDEAYTCAMMGHSFSEIWNITAADVHPPLYYFYLKILGFPFRYNTHVLRFLSGLPAIAMLAVSGWQLRKLFNERFALLFMFLFLFYPYTMDHIVEIRMYSLAEFLIMVCAIWAYRCFLWNKAKDWVIFALSGTCAALSHYFALVSAGIIYILLFIACFRKKSLFKGWGLASAATVVAYLPWLGCFVMQLMFKVNNEYWIEPITLSTFVGMARTVFGASAFYTSVMFMGAVYAVAFVILLVKKNKERTILGLCMLAVPLFTVVIGVAASMLVRPVFVIRYVMPSIPLMVLFFAFVISDISDEMVVSALVTVALVAGLSNLTYMTKHVLMPDSNRMTQAKADALPQHSAYVVIPDFSLHPSQEFAHFDPQTPVYAPDPIVADNPYPNRFEMGDYVMDEHDAIILVLDTGMDIPEEYLAHYAQVESIYSVSVSGTIYDLWHLTTAE